MARAFNVTGPCNPEHHYMLPAAERLPEAPALIEEGLYFVVHAPRQTGKTTAIEALAAELTASGRYAAVAFSCQPGSAYGEDVGAAQHELMQQLRLQARLALPSELQPPEWPKSTPGGQVSTGLQEWALTCPLPLVLFFDEIDSLVGSSLVSVLSQLRSGHSQRPRGFAASVILCGMRDVKDYKAASGGDVTRFGSSSPFNIKAGSFRLRDFTLEEVATLYGQHTAETGQEFTDAGVEYAFELTQGQPWLVNALAREVTRNMGVPVDEAIGPRRFDVARERLIAERATHLDSLAARLREPRVRQVIQPLLVGEPVSDPAPEVTFDDAVSYVRDLGLIARDAPLRIANPIYGEVIPRVLGADAAHAVTADPRTFIHPDGRLDFDKLMREFVEFWRANGEILTEREGYHEAAPHLVLMAWLYKLVNGGGYVDREHAAGRGRTDLLIRWPHEDPKGTRVWQREVLELKVWHPGRPDPLTDGLAQLDGYLDRLTLDTGVLVIFDCRPDARPLCDRTLMESATSPTGRTITVIRA